MKRRSFLKGLAASAGLVVLDPILPVKRIWALGAPAVETLDFKVSYYGSFYWVSKDLLSDAQAFFPPSYQDDAKLMAHLDQDFTHFRSLLPFAEPDWRDNGRDFWMRIPPSINIS